jgi:hypothetical protein
MPFMTEREEGGLRLIQRNKKIKTLFHNEQLYTIESDNEFTIYKSERADVIVTICQMLQGSWQGNIQGLGLLLFWVN